MELTEAIHGRRSARAFTQKPVTKSILETLIADAVQAPSAVNEQPWHFTVIQNQALLDKISASSKAFMVKVLEAGNLPKHLREHLELPDFQIFYQAPVLLVISSNVGDWATENATLAAENLMLAAYGHGLGSCWIGLAQHWLQTTEGKHSINLPDEFVPVAPIIVGYPAGELPPVARYPARVHWIV